MENVVLAIHLILALAIIGLVLLQRSEGGGLGIGGSGGGLGNLATAKTMGNALTRATAICAAGFFCTSLILGVMAGQDANMRTSLSEALGKNAVLEEKEETPDADMITIEDNGTDTTDDLPSAPIAE